MSKFLQIPRFKRILKSRYKWLQLQVEQRSLRQQYARFAFFQIRNSDTEPWNQQTRKPLKCIVNMVEMKFSQEEFQVYRKIHIKLWCINCFWERKGKRMVETKSTPGRDNSQWKSAQAGAPWMCQNQQGWCSWESVNESSGPSVREGILFRVLALCKYTLWCSYKNKISYHAFLRMYHFH
jgi:hypothetical protein